MDTVFRQWRISSLILYTDGEEVVKRYEKRTEKTYMYRRKMSPWRNGDIMRQYIGITISLCRYVGDNLTISPLSNGDILRPLVRQWSRGCRMDPWESCNSIFMHQVQHIRGPRSQLGRSHLAKSAVYVPAAVPKSCYSSTESWARSSEVFPTSSKFEYHNKRNNSRENLSVST